MINIRLIAITLILLTPLLANNIILKNRYLLGGTTFQEDILIPRNLYKKRNKKIIEKDGTYYLQENTLVEIIPDNILNDGYVLAESKKYIGSYFLFIKNQTNTLTIANRTQKKTVNFIMDNSGPVISLKILPNVYNKNKDTLICKSGSSATILYQDLLSGTADVSFSLNDELYQMYAKKITFNKNCKISISAKDALGNSATIYFNIEIDDTPPALSYAIEAKSNSYFTQLNNQVSFNGHLKISLSSTDKTSEVSTIFYTLNTSEVFLKYSSSLSIKNNATLYFYSSDPLFNSTLIKKLIFITDNKSIPGILIK